MEKCKTVEMRKNLETVELYKKYGINFAVIPVLDTEDKTNLIKVASDRLSKIIELVEIENEE